jgi:hypothetical protein
MSSLLKANSISAATGTTVTIPSGTTLDIASGATLDTTGATVSGLTTGKVLQVVQTVKSDVFSTGARADSPVEITGLTASITPASSSNKILVMFSMSFGSSGSNNGHCFLYRDATVIQIGDADGSRPQSTKSWETSADWNQSAVNIVCVDSPATTSSVTYSVKIGGNGTATCYLNRSGRHLTTAFDDSTEASQVILMEIGA